MIRWILILHKNCVPFVERMNDYVGGVVVSFDIILFTDIKLVITMLLHHQHHL